MLRIHRILILTGLLLTVGCLPGPTTPVAIPIATKTPSDRVLAFQNPDQVRTCQVVVVRDQGILGGACYYALHINGVFAARMNPGELVRLYVEPGNLLLKVSRDPLGKWGCALWKDSFELQSTIKAGETKSFRMGLKWHGHCYLISSQ